MVIASNSVVVSNITMDYIDHSDGNWVRLGRSRKIRALSDISFSVNKGDVVALVGRNGSGKSTLLKGIAGLLRPTDGSISTQGRVILLAGVNPGFSMEATGRENILELARAYGIGKTELSEFAQSIIDFADIGDAIDRRVKGYSTGMKGKLGFGFITALRPDVLLIDETLGVGDQEFRARAQDRLRGFVAISGAVVMSTHSLGLARELCSRGLVIDRGEIVADAEIEDAMLAYRDLLNG